MRDIHPATVITTITENRTNQCLEDEITLISRLIQFTYDVRFLQDMTWHAQRLHFERLTLVFANYLLQSRTGVYVGGTRQWMIKKNALNQSFLSPFYWAEIWIIFNFKLVIKFHAWKRDFFFNANFPFILSFLLESRSETWLMDIYKGHSEKAHFTDLGV